MIMKVFLTILIIFSSVDLVFGQYYNKLLDADIGLHDIPYYSYSNNNNIYTASNIPPAYYCLLSKIDETGNIAAQKKIDNLFLNPAIVLGNRLHCIGDSLIVLPTNSELEFHIYSLDLDSLDKKEYNLPELDIEHYYGPGYMVHNDVYVYLVGSLIYQNHPLDIISEGLIIRLFRSNLELDTVSVYPTDVTDITFHHPKIDNTGSLSIGYEKFDRNSTPVQPHYGMLKFDNDFNVIQEVELPYYGQRDLTGENYELENGNFIFADEGRDTIGATWGSRAALHCMTPEGEEVWRKDELNLTGIGVTRPIEDYETARFNADGNLVFASIFHDGSSSFEARLMCIEPTTGEVVWQRYFEAPEGVGTDGVRGTLNNLHQDDEGNLTLVGHRGTSLSEGVNHWLIRTDSHGCIEPGCETTSTESETNNKPEELFKLIQNPISQSLTLSISSKLNGQQSQINLFDSSGKKVHSESLIVRNDTYSIPTFSLPNGMYFLEIKTENNVMQSGKVVVQH